MVREEMYGVRTTEGVAAGRHAVDRRAVAELLGWSVWSTCRQAWCRRVGLHCQDQDPRTSNMA